MPAGHLVIAPFILPVIEVMFSLSPNRTRSDKPNTTLVSFTWMRIRANIEHNLHESSPRVCISHHTSGQAERHLRSCKAQTESEQLAEVEEKCDVRYPTLTVPLKQWLAARDGIAKTDIWIWWNFVSKHSHFFVNRLFYGAKSVPAKMSLLLHAKMYLGNSFTKYDNVKCD